MSEGNAASAKLAVEGAFAQGAWGKTQPPTAPNADEKLWGMLANVGAIFWIFGPAVVFFMKGKTSPFVKFNALQMIFFCVVMFVVSIALQIVFTVLATVPIVAQLLLPLWSLVGLAFLVLWIFISIQAYSGVLFRLPVIGNIAFKNAYNA
jgi:uncharacterized membrane protein